MSAELEPTASIATSGGRVEGASRALVLRIVWPRAHAGAIPLSSPSPLVLGRGTHASLDHSSVSRAHLGAKVRGLAAQVWDAGSRHGSWLDGSRLDETPRSAPPGSVLRLAELVGVVELREASPADEDDALLALLPGQAPVTAALRRTLARVARGSAPVLLLGETGTGKEFAARAIHVLSGREPFVATNCAGLSAAMADSQLFGHKKGAFTGASEARAGLFRQANGGLLFLDEVAELPLEVQAKLLRAVESHEVVPLGSDRPERVDVRLVAATHPDLPARVADGRFRRDLYARLRLAELSLPPLARRRGDIAGWVERLDSRWAERDDEPAQRWRAEAIATLCSAAWPENLRGVDRVVYQLRLAAGIEAPRSAAQVQAVLGEEPPEVPVASAAAPPASPSELPPKPSREELERALLEHGSVRATAKAFRRDRRQIYRWMDAYGIER